MSEEYKSPVIRLDEKDNIVVARMAVPAGTVLKNENITVLEDIPVGHKIAVCDIGEGEPVLKCSTVIGNAAKNCPAGSHMHNDEIRFDPAEQKYEFCADFKPLDIVPIDKRRTFMGIVREDGRIATRNCICVIVCSNCAATVARKIAAHFDEEYLKKYPNVDAVVPMIHESGCGLERSGPDMDNLRLITAGMVKHPNMFGSVVVALGCENNNIDVLFETMGLEEGPRMGRIVIQEEGGSIKAVKKGIELIEAMLPEADKVSRQPVPVSELKVGMECGGSDTFSSAGANPALGKAMDILCGQGGTCVLTEPTELLGCEGTLVRRARTPEVAQKVIDMMQWWLKAGEGRDCQINGKVTPGNNAGGITNTLEKALGSAKKGGSTPLNDVIWYAEPLKEPGFNIMSSPSFDPMSAAALFASGCNMLVFTTGRGSCYGTLHMPTIKVCSNTERYEFQKDDMDLNAGTIVDGTESLEDVAGRIFEELVEVAGGKKTKSELFGMGNDEFMVWRQGIIS
ncbi:MAG: altronate dehydratase family protein [Eubacteriales bacterium]|nr:altronate dehydratase family protein [Eubacteriales bacterium]